MNNEFEKIEIFSDNRNVKENNRISWDQYFMNEAINASKRSHDCQTKHRLRISKR